MSQDVSSGAGVLSWKACALSILNVLCYFCLVWFYGWGNLGLEKWSDLPKATQLRSSNNIKPHFYLWSCISGLLVLAGYTAFYWNTMDQKPYAVNTGYKCFRMDISAVVFPTMYLKASFSFSEIIKSSDGLFGCSPVQWTAGVLSLSHGRQKSWEVMWTSMWIS